MHLQLLHTPSLHMADGRIQLLPPNDAALLAVLAIDGPTSRETMAHLLWPDAPGEGARVNLRQRLSRWKTRPGLVLQDRGGHTLALPLATGGNAHADADATLTHDLQGLVERLHADPAAARGDLLGNHAYEDNPRLAHWVQRARMQWRSGLREALAAIAEQLEREHRIAQALPYAARIAQEDPLAEHAHRRVMRLHYLRGDRSAALAAYDRLRTLLRDELGIVPSRETLDLGRLIESGTGAGVDGMPAPAPRPVAVLRPPRLVGRGAELGQALAAWADGGHLLIVGEAGIGKSRFIDELAGRLGIGLRTQARQGDAGVPYALLGRLLRAARPGTAPAEGLPPWAAAELARIVPAFGLPAGGAMIALRLAEAARLAIGADSALCIDDLQYADTATLELLPAIAAPPLQCVLAVRSDNVPAAVDAWAAGGGTVPVHTVPLGPLDAASVQALLESLALPFVDGSRWRGVLMQHTGGNPLFLLETVRELLRGGGALGLQLDGTALRLPLPAEVTRLIERRFDALSPLALKLLRLAALAGQDYAADMAAEVLGIDLLALAEPWSELAAAHLFGDNGFAHDLAQEAAARSVPAAVAAALHQALAVALEQRADVAAARIAAHWLKARQWPAAARQFERAAQAARSAGRPPEEVALLEQASVCFERAGDRDGRFRVRVAAVEPALSAESIARASARAQDLVDEAADERQRLAALLAQVQCSTAGISADTRSAEQAVALARRLGDLRSQRLAATYLAAALARAGDATGAIAMYETHAELTKDAPPDLHFDHEVLSMYAALLYLDGRYAQALSRYQDVSRFSEAAGDLANATVQYANAANCQLHLGNPAGAVEAAEQALAVWTRQGKPSGIAGGSALLFAGAAHLQAGTPGRATECAERALALFQLQRVQTWIVLAENIVARVHLRLGQVGRARRFLAWPITETLVLPIQGRRLALHCLAMRRSGSPVPFALKAQLQDIAMRVPETERLPMLMVHAALLDAEEALESFEALIPAAALRRPALALACRVQAADALRRLHRPADALLMARQTTDEAALKLVPADIEPGERWSLLYQVFHAAGATDEADLALRHGVAAIEAELPQVPEPFRDSFLHRNPFNRDLMRAARSRFTR